MVRRILLLFLLAIVVVAVAAVAISWPRYRAAMAEGRKVLDGGTIVETALGPVDYAEEGIGPAVLVVHGAGGGRDQGGLIGRVFVGDDFRRIAPSRFGYLDSPVPDDATPAAQADLYAALLDRLGIDRVAVVAVSDGGPSALQFALRHPARTSALVMLSAKSMTPPATSPIQEAAFELIFRNDYVFWVISSAARSSLADLFGVDPAVLDEAGPDAQRLATGIMSDMNPIGLRRPGIENDRATMALLPPEVFPLERIAAPTLVVHAEDDGLQSYAHGVNTATHIPGAEFASWERGGHMLLLQYEEARGRIAAFLRAHGDDGAGG